jgi:archaemetzincin
MIHIMSVIGTEKTIKAREVEEALEDEFGLPIRRRIVDVPAERFCDSKRNQYLSTGILKELLYSLSPDAVKAVGIVPFDLFIPVLTFVFGEAQLNGKVAIVSTARLDQTFYGLAPNQPLLQRRLIKEIKHELGHTFGLLHCSQRLCVMSLANTILDVDRKASAFCSACKDELGTARANLLKTITGSDLQTSC